MRDDEARNGAALIFTAGAGLAVTAYAAVALYLVRNHPNYVFWLGLGALFLIAIVITGLTSLLSKRTIEATIAGQRIVIADQVQQAVREAVPMAVAAGVVAAQTAAPPVDGPKPKG